MYLQDLACGIWPLIEDGIKRYEREHGSKPVALVLHPAHANEFCSGAESDDSILDGIAVIQNVRVTGPNYGFSPFSHAVPVITPKN
jgi:hypothetical protein